MRLSRALRPAWSLAAFGLALSLLTLPVVARAADDDDDNNNDNGRQGTVRIYGSDDDAQGGYLGVQVQDVTVALQRARNLPTDEGALVSRVEDDSPADQSGIRRGDVITNVNRQKIDNSADLIRVVRGLSPGDRARVTVWRSGSVRTVAVQVGERPKGMTGMGMMQHPMMPPEVPMTPNGDMQRQIRDLQDQVRELRQEIQSLRQEIHSQNNDNRDNDRSRDRDQDNGD
ncbi:MAG: S1C family serine protease [Bacteroidota bacterium]